MNTVSNRPAATKSNSIRQHELDKHSRECNKGFPEIIIPPQHVVSPNRKFSRYHINDRMVFDQLLDLAATPNKRLSMDIIDVINDMVTKPMHISLRAPLEDLCGDMADIKNTCLALQGVSATTKSVANSIMESMLYLALLRMIRSYEDVLMRIAPPIESDTPQSYALRTNFPVYLAEEIFKFRGM